jgi:hypothetical protein
MAIADARVGPCPAETIRQATASLSALRVSPALPAAVNSRARRFPGSENSASPMFDEIELAARRRSSSALSRWLMRGISGTSASTNDGRDHPDKINLSRASRPVDLRSPARPPVGSPGRRPAFTRSHLPASSAKHRDRIPLRQLLRFGLQSGSPRTSPCLIHELALGGGDDEPPEPLER